MVREPKNSRSELDHEGHLVWFFPLKIKYEAICPKPLVEELEYSGSDHKGGMWETSIRYPLATQ